MLGIFHRPYALNTCVLRQLLLDHQAATSCIADWITLSKFRIAPCAHDFVSRTQPSASCCTAADAMSLPLNPSQNPHKLRIPSWKVGVYSRRSSSPCKTQQRDPITPAALCIRTSLGGGGGYKNRRAKVLSCLCVDIDSKPRGVCFSLLICAKSI